MDQWVGKVAVVTGATTGIGSTICVELVKAGMIVCGLAKRQDKVEALRPLTINAKGHLNAVECDITSEQSVHAAFSWIEKAHGGVDLLVNNAGFISNYLLLDDNNVDEFQKMLDTNLIGLIIVTKKALKMMKDRERAGVVVNINSILGHRVNTCVPGSRPLNGMYTACKFALNAITECLRQELLYKQINARIMSLSPGLVKNDIITYKSTHDIIKLMPHLDPVHVANALMYIITTPDNVLIQDMIIKPDGEFL